MGKKRQAFHVISRGMCASKMERSREHCIAQLRVIESGTA